MNAAVYKYMPNSITMKLEHVGRTTVTLLPEEACPST